METILQDEIQTGIEAVDTITTENTEPQSPEITMKRRIEILHTKRTLLATKSAANKEALGNFIKTRSQDLADETELKNEVAILEAEIKDKAVAAYKFQPTIGKKPWAGVGIQCGEQITYHYDISNAMDWAIEKKLCLSLDTAAFEALCATQSKPAFVTEEKIDTVKAVLDKDLSKALGLGG
jgi:hypothetical protein